jgi:hypothetical protein
MQMDQVVEVLSFANGNERTVRLVMVDGTEVVGVPTSVDLHPTAMEVFLQPLGDDDTEIGVSLTGIRLAELL